MRDERLPERRNEWGVIGSLTGFLSLSLPHSLLRCNFQAVPKRGSSATPSPLMRPLNNACRRRVKGKERPKGGRWIEYGREGIFELSQASFVFSQNVGLISCLGHQQKSETEEEKLHKARKVDFPQMAQN